MKTLLRYSERDYDFFVDFTCGLYIVDKNNIRVVMTIPVYDC